MRPSRNAVQVRVYRNVVIWAGGNRSAAIDVWFHPAFGDSTAGFRHAFESRLAKHARIFVFDPPGHGASPPRSKGLTLADGVRVWSALISHYSRSRRVVLVGHSMAGMIASDTAATLQRKPPILVVGVETNLTRSDAYFTGLAAQFDDPMAFYRSLLSKIRHRGRRDESFARFAASLTHADPMTLWTLGRSVFKSRDPGFAFRRLRCGKIYYWDSTRASKLTREYVAQYRLPNRRLDHLGHWPMISAPERFYAAIEEDIAMWPTGREIR